MKISSKRLFFTPRPKPQVGGAVFYLITESRSHFTRTNNYLHLAPPKNQKVNTLNVNFRKSVREKNVV
jgi:hypothetical protein